MGKRVRGTASSPFLPTVEWRVGRGTKRTRVAGGGGGRWRRTITEARRRRRERGERMRYADREVRARRRTAERVERTRKTGETGREKKCTCVEEKKSEEKLEREDEREYSSPGVGIVRGVRGVVQR